MNKLVILLIIVFLLCYMSYENKENLVCNRLSNTPYYITEDGRKLVEVPNNQRQQIANAISNQGVTGDTMGINNQGVMLGTPETGNVIDANNQGVTGEIYQDYNKNININNLNKGWASGRAGILELSEVEDAITANKGIYQATNNDKNRFNPSSLSFNTSSMPSHSTFMPLNANGLQRTSDPVNNYISDIGPSPRGSGIVCSMNNENPPYMPTASVFDKKKIKDLREIYI